MSYWTRKTTRGMGASRRLKVEPLENRLCLSSYTMVDLLPLPADPELGRPAHDYSAAGGMNDNGLVVGSSELLFETPTSAVVWSVDQEGGVTVCELAVLDGASSSGASEVNNQGMIVGEAGSRAVLWTPTSDPEHPYAVHDLGSGYARSVSEPDVNGNVWVVGNSLEYGGVLWQVDSEGTLLSTIDLWGGVYDVKVIGDSVFVAGSVSADDPIFAQACTWEVNLDGTVVERTDLVSADYVAHYAYALNNDGDVAGDASDPVAKEHLGFLYESGDSSFTKLESLGRGWIHAYGINDSHVVVGAYNKKDISFNFHAFVWEDGEMHDLLKKTRGNTFWYLHRALDVNNNGEIVGTGKVGRPYKSQDHGFLARPEGTTGQQSPDAVDDPATTDMDTPVTIDVLANDTDPDGDPLDVIAVTQGSDGAVAINPDDTVTYTPTPGFLGTDSFTYTVSDGNGGEDTAPVTVTVRDPSAGQSYPSTDTSLPLADGHPVKGDGVSTSIISPGVAVVLDAGELTSTHEAVSELTVSLISPTSDIVVLSSPQNITLVSGQLMRYEDLGLTDTETGDWTLEVRDSAKGNRGTLESWTLFVAAEAGGTAASEPLAADSFFSDLGDGSDEDNDDILQPEIAELLLYDR